MDIDNPELVRFSNEKGRICADSVLQAYNIAKQFIDHWNHFSSPMPNTTDEIADGSQSSMGNSADGRKAVTVEKYNQFRTACKKVITLMESNNDEIKNLLLTIAVNGQARF